MGAGLYRHSDGQTVFIDLSDERAEDDVLDFAFDDVAINIEGLLLDTSFTSPMEITWRRERNGGRVLAENSLYQIWMTSDDYDNAFITYGLSEDLADDMEGIARHHLDERAARFFDRLQEIYDLRVATTAWTSAPRALAFPEPQPLQAA